MNELLDKVFYKSEWIPKNSNVNLLNLCKSSGGVILEKVGREGVVGVKFHESLYSDVKRSELATGARTLYIRKDNPEKVMLRGMNKFDDFEDISHLILNTSIQQHISPVLIQRKIAGFLVVISATEEDPNLLISSKHVLKGKHVTLAQRLLHKEWNYEHVDEREAKLRTFLLSNKVSLICEGVDSIEDTWHPVSEPPLHQGLSLLCLIKFDSLREETSIDLLSKASAAASGLKISPYITNPSWSDIANCVKKCETWDRTGDSSEGHVLTFSVDKKLVLEHFGNEEPQPSDHNDKAYFRVKLKTLRYKIQRQLRQLICKMSEKGSEIEVVRLWPSLTPYQKVIVSYICEKQKQVFQQKQCDVTNLLKNLENSLNKEQSIVWNDLVTNLRPVLKPTNHLLVIAVGLPGSGKTTFLKKLANDETCCKGRRIIYLSKDDITVQEQERCGKQDVTRAVHHRLLHLLHFVANQARDSFIVIVDGCNLTKGSRRMLSRVLPNYLTVNFTTDIKTCTERASNRSEHPTLDPLNAAIVINSMVGKLSYEDQGSYYNVNAQTFNSTFDMIQSKITTIINYRMEDEKTSPLIGIDSVKMFFSCDASSLLSDLGLHIPFITKLCSLSHVSVESVDKKNWFSQIESTLKNIIKKTCGRDSCDQQSIVEMLTGWTTALFGKSTSLTITDSSNLQWLKGSLEKIRHKSGNENNLYKTLLSHYRVEQYIRQIHCTLVYVGGRIPEEPADIEMAMRINQKRDDLNNKDSIITCDRLIIDSKGLCLGVSKVDLLLTPTGWKAPLVSPLGFLPKGAHVTLGVTSKEEASYCGTLVSSITEWSRQNIAGVDERKSKKLKRRKTDFSDEFHSPECETPDEPRRKFKFHNSVEVKIDPPIQLRGTIKYIELDSDE